MMVRVGRWTGLEVSALDDLKTFLVAAAIARETDMASCGFDRWAWVGCLGRGKGGGNMGN